MLIPTPLDTLCKIASLMGKMIHQIVPNSSDCQAVRSRSPGVVPRFFAKPKNWNRNRTLEPLNLRTCCWETGLLCFDTRAALLSNRLDDAATLADDLGKTRQEQFSSGCLRDVFPGNPGFLHVFYHQIGVSSKCSQYPIPGYLDQTVLIHMK